MKRKRKIALAIAAAVCALLAGVCGVVMAVLAGTLESQQAADRWRGESEERFAQFSVFFPVGSELNAMNLYSFHDTVESKLIEGGLEQPETGSLWAEGYSAKGKITVEGSRGSSGVTAMGVGGDFFVFHPMRLRSGSYISGSDLMDDRVVLDEELAWRLFGGVELEGLTVTIGGKPYYIAGVVERETDFASSKAYNDGPGIFMSYSALDSLGACNGISCYELVCADPISGFAESIVAEAFSNDGAYPIVENSSRYSLGSIFRVIGDFGERAMNTYGVVYPYWENAARLIEDYMALCLVLLILFALLPVSYLLVLAFIWARRGLKAAKAGVVHMAGDMQDKRYRNSAERREGRAKRKAAGKRARAEEKLSKAYEKSANAGEMRASPPREDGRDAKRHKAAGENAEDAKKRAKAGKHVKPGGKHSRKREKETVSSSAE